MREEWCGFKAIFEWVRGRIRSKALRIRSRLWKDCWRRMMITTKRMMGKMMRVLPIRDDERGRERRRKEEGRKERTRKERNEERERKKEKKVPNVIVLIAFGSIRYDTKQKHTPKTPDTSKHFKRVFSILLHHPPPPTLPHHHLNRKKKNHSIVVVRAQEKIRHVG